MFKTERYKYGDIVNGVKYLRPGNHYCTPLGKSVRKGIFECVKCEKEFETNVCNVSVGHHKGIKTMCTSCATFIGNTIHGLSRTKAYKIWRGIKERCYDSNHEAFHNYGGRGIDMFSIWKEDSIVFCKYIESLSGYSDELTLDRENNDKGYYPGNLRWTTNTVQSINQRPRGNRTGYLGVKKQYNKYCFQIRTDEGRIKRGSFETVELAAVARDQYIIDNKLLHPLQVLKQTG